MLKKPFFFLFLALPFALFAAPQLKFQAFDDSFVTLDDFKKGTWRIVVEIDHKNLHFSYTGRVKASEGSSTDLRVSIDEIDFMVAYWDIPTVVNGEEYNFAMAEMVGFWDDISLVFSEGTFTLLPPWNKNRQAQQSLQEGKKLTDGLIKSTPSSRWDSKYEKEIDLSFDDIWNKRELKEIAIAEKEEGIAAAKAKEEAERLAKLEEERQMKLAAEREAKKLAKEKEDSEKAKAARAERRRKAKTKRVPEPEVVAEEAVDTEESYSQAVKSTRLVKDDKLRNNLTWTLLSIGAVSTIVAIVEHRNMTAAKYLYDQYVTYNPINIDPTTGAPNANYFMATSYDKVKKDHEMNRNIAAALSVVTLGTSFVIYKF